MTKTMTLHEATKNGDLATLKALLDDDPALCNARSETDGRGTYPLHVAAQFGQAEAARLLVASGADVELLDAENSSSALSWAAFFGRPEVARVLLDAGSQPNQRNRHGLTPLGCALGGAQGKWQAFSDATLEAWGHAAELIRSRGGLE